MIYLFASMIEGSKKSVDDQGRVSATIWRVEGLYQIILIFDDKSPLFM